MMRQWRLSVFFLRQFLSVPYFLQLMVMTTIAATIVQFAAYSAWGAITPTQGWVRAGVIGMWTVATTSAGIIGFERYKGTLVFLVLAPIGAWRPLVALVSSAALAGLGSFPLAWATWAVLAQSVTFTVTDLAGCGRIAAGILLLFLGCLALSLAVAALFVLTPNAIAYEELLLVPVFIASGILFTSGAPGWVDVLSRFLPLRFPFELLSLGPVSLTSALTWPVVAGAWLAFGGIAGARALRLATRAGTVEVM